MLLPRLSWGQRIRPRAWASLASWRHDLSCRWLLGARSLTGQPLSEKDLLSSTQTADLQRNGRGESKGNGGSLPDRTPGSLKPVYITTPIFYVNAEPHVGHLYTMVLADVYKRWELFYGRPAILSTGTDEHGVKVERAASAHQTPVREWVDKTSAVFRRLADTALVSYDRYARTSTDDHRRAVEHVWCRLQDNGWLYKGKRSGWYSEADECFYPCADVTRSVHAQSGVQITVAAETGSEVEQVEEDNWFFRLTSLQERLQHFYGKHPDWVRPPVSMAQVTDWVDNRLQDLAVSRPVARGSWAIPVPGDPTQNIYVWLDALTNYLTQVGYGTASEGWDSCGALGFHPDGWPADVHVVGKDIVRFHAVYWPAFLLALDLPLPGQIVSHGHWTINGKKMSKSTGTTVDPFLAMQRWGPDAVRFYLMLNGGSSLQRDPKYSHDLAHWCYVTNLRRGIGNTINRVCLPANGSWSVDAAVRASAAACSGVWHHTDLFKNLQALPHHMVKAAEERDISNGIKYCMEVIFEINRFWDNVKPWLLATSRDDPDASHRLDEAVFLAADALRVVAIFLQPIMPGKMADMLDRLGVSPDHRDARHAGFRKDLAYGLGGTHPPQEGLFPAV